MLIKDQMCGYHSEIDACQGDSGGPLTTKIGQRSYQVGVVSYGNTVCGRKE